MAGVNEISQRLVANQQNKPKVGGWNSLSKEEQDRRIAAERAWKAAGSPTDGSYRAPAGGLQGISSRANNTVSDETGSMRLASRAKEIETKYRDWKSRNDNYDRQFGDSRGTKDMAMDWDKKKAAFLGAQPGDQSSIDQAYEVANMAKSYEDTGEFFAANDKTPFVIPYANKQLYQEYGDAYAKQHVERHNKLLTDEQFKAIRPSDYQAVFDYLRPTDMFQHTGINDRTDWDTPFVRGKRLGKWKTRDEYTAFINGSDDLKSEAEWASMNPTLRLLKKNPWIAPAAAAAVAVGGAALVGAGAAAGGAAGAGTAAAAGAGAGGATISGGAAAFGTGAGAAGAGAGGAGLGLSGLQATEGIASGALSSVPAQSAAGLAAGADVGVGGASIAGATMGSDAASLAAAEQGAGLSIPSGPSGMPAVNTETIFGNMRATDLGAKSVEQSTSAWSQAVDKMGSAVKSKMSSLGDLFSGKVSLSEFSTSAMNAIGKKGAKALLMAALGGFSRAEKNEAKQSAARAKITRAQVVDQFKLRRRALDRKYGRRR